MTLEGRIRRLEHIQEIRPRLENAYGAFTRLFRGANTGKLILKIAD